MAMSWQAVVGAYILGGLTFLPLCLAIAITLVLRHGTEPVGEGEGEGEGGSRALGDGRQDASGDTTGRPSPSSLDLPDQIYGLSVSECLETQRTGWIVARREFMVKPPESTYAGLLAQSYRSFIDARSSLTKETQVGADIKDKVSSSGSGTSATRTTARKPGSFYAVLKRHTLYLYENEDQIDCAHVISLALHTVFIHPKGLSDAEMFLKRHAICIHPRDEAVAAALPSETSSVAHQDVISEMAQFRPWYLFTSNPSEKEDWYFSLVVASRLGAEEEAKLSGKTCEPASNVGRDTRIFASTDMKSLLETLDATPEQLPTRWLNAILGRVFFGLYRTDWLEKYITSRIEKKIARVKTPSFLSAIKVREVFAGTTAPMLSRPMLRELTEHGNATVEAGVSYHGDFRIVMEALATFNLGSRFKPYTVKLVLAIRLKELEGTIQVKIKKPPSNRVWFAFTQPPRMSLLVEPVVSTRQIKWAMILRAIETRITETMVESIVLPNMDDISFFNTRASALRGGIWGDLARKDRNEDGTVKEESVAELAAGASEPQPKLDQSGAGLRQRKPDPASAKDVDPPGRTSRSLSVDALSEDSPKPSKKKSWFATSAKTNPRTATLPEPVAGPVSSADLRADERSIRSVSPILVESSGQVAGTDHRHLSSEITPAVESDLVSDAGQSSHEKGSSTAAVSSDPSLETEEVPDAVLLQTSPTQPEPKTEHFAPPPRHSTAASTDPGDLGSRTLYQNWKKKAGQVDRQAVQASVSQAKDTMRKWGATWAAKRSVKETPLYYPGKVYGAGHPIPMAEQDLSQLVSDRPRLALELEEVDSHAAHASDASGSGTNPTAVRARVSRVMPPAVERVVGGQPKDHLLPAEPGHTRDGVNGTASSATAELHGTKPERGTHDANESWPKGQIAESRPIQTDQRTAYSPPSMMIPGQPTSPKRLNAVTVPMSSSSIDTRRIGEPRRVLSAQDGGRQSVSLEDVSSPLARATTIEEPALRRDNSPSSSLRSRAGTLEGSPLTGGGAGQALSATTLPGQPSLAQTTTLNAQGASSSVLGLSPPRSLSSTMMPSLVRGTKNNESGSEAAKDILQRLVSHPASVSSVTEDAVAAAPTLPPAKPKPPIPSETKPKLQGDILEQDKGLSARPTAK